MLGQPVEHRLGRRALAFEQQPAHRVPAGAGGERDQAFHDAPRSAERHLRRFAVAAVQEGVTDQRHQVAGSRARSAPAAPAGPGAEAIGVAVADRAGGGRPVLAPDSELAAR